MPSSSEGFTAAPWSRLWRAGVLHSCATAITGNYDGEIHRFWTEQFLTLADGACVLDVGTGNGAVAVLARDHARERAVEFDIHGIDVADISPVASRTGGSGFYRGIEFHPRTSIDKTPFKNGSVDLVCCQYVFEYTSIPASIAEMHRILKAHGRIAMILHSDDSVIARVSLKQLEGCDYLLSNTPTVERTRKLLELFLTTPYPEQRRQLANDSSAEAIRSSFNMSAAEVMDRVAAKDCPEVLRTFAQRLVGIVRQGVQDPRGALSALDDAVDSLVDERERLRQMRAALLDEAALLEIAARFGALGYGVACGSLRQEGDVKMGWTLVATNG
ncbi:class I SAM-dependent methyltransferase [Novilysobacter antarcticus]|uniref:class I SAM-dependent methyltransferase n=1 Tax=Novilysobacter antarcticus TaxID=2862543 RepID=UPI001C99AD10|nr:class I SAM-dependent methyltransferase [Lysobacter antarcticus]